MKHKLTPVRLSHLCSTQGPGSIVKTTDDLSVAIKDIRYWSSDPHAIEFESLVNVTRIKQCRGIIQDLKEPPIAEAKDDVILGTTIPSVIFPNYAVCNACKKLHIRPWNISNNFTGKVYCQNPKCKSQYPLIQGSWCNISENGQLSEVNWRSICHSGAKDPKQKQCKSENLVFTENKIKCLDCKAESSYKNKKNQKFIHDQPWLNSLEEGTNDFDALTDSKESKRKAKVQRKLAEINSPEVYSPVVTDGVVIPPESNNQSSTDIIEYLAQKSVAIKELTKKNLPPIVRKSKLKSVAKEFSCTEQEVEQAILKVLHPEQKNEEAIGKEGEMLFDEYQALMTAAHFPPGADFITTHVSQYFKEQHDSLPDELKPIVNLVDTLVCVDRLRKINIFMGFNRLKPSGGEFDEEVSIDCIPPDIVGVSSWLPAIELFGEGIFFSLSEGFLEQWENLPEVVKRAEEIKERFENADIFIEETVDARYILLHTLAHLLIRELELNCGYPASSLEERIYSSREKGMQGILIYTAVADINGSLGGLIEQAKPDKFVALFDSALKHAEWCSLDPVCSEHKGQGLSGLNKAACHACCLIPETSCQVGNILLDRTFIKGNSEGIPSLKQVVGVS